MKKRVNKILSLVLVLLLCAATAGCTSSCKYKDVAGTYKITRSDGTVQTLVLKASGKFTHTKKRVSLDPDERTGTFTVNDKIITLTFDKKAGEPPIDDATEFTILSNGNLQTGSLIYKKQ